MQHQHSDYVLSRGTRLLARLGRVALLESLRRKSRQDKGRFVDLRIVVLAELDLLVRRPGPKRHLDIAARLLAAHHEANLSGRVGRDGSVGVLGDGEDLFAVRLELGDEGQVKPLVLGCERNVSNTPPFDMTPQKQSDKGDASLRKPKFRRAEAGNPRFYTALRGRHLGRKKR